MRSSAWALCGLGVLSVACGSEVSHAVAEFETGRLPEADHRFRALGPSFETLSPKERAEYALYRGLTHLALGDVREAERWIATVKHALDRNPALLTRAERGRCLAAWRSMGHMPGD